MSETPTAEVTGLLLAGGQSRRMGRAFASGKGDKGLLDIAGKPMLGYVMERLAPQVGAMVINANGDPARFASFGLPVVPDSIQGFVGPLAGILAGMRWAEANVPDARHVVSVSTDAPFLPHDLVARLATALEAAGARIALARSGGELHPVIGLWPVDLADDLEAALKSGTRKVLDWTDRHGATGVDFPFVTIHDRPIDPFFNANTPEELAEARALLTP
jgi:molybdopterin-guanine dinucleotide biosynthesis protein A